MQSATTREFRAQYFIPPSCTQPRSIGITTNAEYRFILTLTRCIRVRGNVERMMCERERISGACIRRADSFAFQTNRRSFALTLTFVTAAPRFEFLIQCTQTSVNINICTYRITRSIVTFSPFPSSVQTEALFWYRSFGNGHWNNEVYYPSMHRKKQVQMVAVCQISLLPNVIFCYTHARAHTHTHRNSASLFY